MNVTLFHEYLAAKGFDVLSVDDKGNVFLSKHDEKVDAELGKAVAEYREPTRAEREADILARRDDLLNQLLLERFLGPDEGKYDGLR